MAGGENVCGICLEEYDDNCILLCEGGNWAHKFHRDCITNWINHGVSQGTFTEVFECPTCRRKIPLDIIIGRIPKNLWPTITLTFNGITLSIAGWLLRYLYLLHQQIFVEMQIGPTHFRPMYPNGVPAGHNVHPEWAEMEIPAENYYRNELWRNTKLLAALMCFMILMNFILVYLRIRYQGARGGGGGNNILHIDNKSYTVPSDLAPMLSKILTDLKNSIETLNISENTGNTTSSLRKRTSNRLRNGTSTSTRRNRVPSTRRNRISTAVRP